VAVVLALFLGATVAPADRLVTHDGRVLNVLKARKAPEGGYRLTFEHGEILCPEEYVASVEIEGDMSDYVPKNDDEKKKLDEGFVKYRNRWYSKPAYQAELNKEAQTRRERVEELAAHSDFYDGWTKETKHFVIQTNTSPELLEYYAELLETYYSLMNKRVGIKPTPKLRRTKMKVNIYKSREEFHELNEAGVGGGVAGYFSFLEESLNFYHDYEEPAVSDWVCLHECTHLLTYLIEPQSWPRIWINEGVADFFGSADITRDKKGKIVITPGKIQVDRILTVQQAIKDAEEAESGEDEDSSPGRPYVPLARLFKVEKSDFSAFEYAHAWSFVYFLNNSSKQYASGFKKFFKDHYTLPKGVEYTLEPFPNQQGTAKMLTWQEVRRLLLKHLRLKEKDIPQLERDWLDFISSIEIDAPDARFKRAYMAVRRYDRDQFDQAREDLDFAISEGITDPRAYWARGFLSIVGSHDLDAAEDDFRKACELSPLNASFHYALGQILGGAGFSAGLYTLIIGEAELRGSEERMEEAKSRYGLAAALDPESDFYREKFDEFLEAYETYEESQD